jgi:Tol biopolymer transport system component
VVALSAALLLLAGAVVLALPHFREPLAASDIVRFQFNIPEKAAYLEHLALSPDGKHVVFAALGEDGFPRLWIHSLDSLESHPLAGTDAVTLRSYSFWSWDSRFVVFQTGGYGGSGKLKRVDLSGGPPETLCDLSNILLGGFWSRTGKIVFGTSASGLLELPASGGDPTPLTTLDPTHQERSHAFPVLLPDEHHFIYRVSAKAGDAGIYFGVLNGNSSTLRGKKLLPNIAEALFAPSLKSGASQDGGHLLFVREATLVSQPFDAGRGELTGDAIPIAPTITDVGAFGVSATGVLVYRAAGRQDRQLTWFERGGKILRAAAPAAGYNFLNLSPNDTRAATQRLEKFGEGEIWVLDLTRSGLGTRFTVGPDDAAGPVWSPDGNHIVWASNRDGPYDLYQRPITGGNEEPLLRSNLTKIPFNWSSDGRYLLYGIRDPRSKGDLWVLPMTGERKPWPFANTEFDESQGEFSPDMHWVAYQSDESGTFEIYIRPFPPGSGAGENVRVSNGGGYQPRWRRKDGKELYYLTGEAKLMAVDVMAGPTLKVSEPHLLFSPPIWAGGRSNQVHRWDVSADGQKFLIPTLAQGYSAPFTVVLNWQAALKK